MTITINLGKLGVYRETYRVALDNGRMWVGYEKEGGEYLDRQTIEVDGLDDSSVIGAISWHALSRMAPEFGEV